MAGRFSSIDKSNLRLLTNIVLRLFLSFLAQAKIDNSFILLSDKGENQFMSNAPASILEFQIYVSIPLSIFSPSNLHYKTSKHQKGMVVIERRQS